MKRGETKMVLHREIIRCFRFNPDTLEYECERVYNSDMDDLRGLRLFLDACNVKAKPPMNDA